MNILMGLQAPWIGGTRLHVLHLAQALGERGHRVLLVTDGGWLEEEMARRGIRFLRRVDGLEAMLDLLLAEAKREQFDVIHAHPNAFIWEGCLLSHLTGVPLVVTMHGEYVLQFCRSPLGEKVAETARAVIAVSDQVEQYLLSQTPLPAAKIRVVRNGIDTREYRPGRDVERLRAALGLPQGHLVVAYVGRLDPDKGAAIRATAEAFCRLAAAGLPLTGLFVGQGGMVAELQERAGRAEAFFGRPVLRLTGFRRDLADLFCLADVVVAAGRSALEAMAAGRPVVAAGRAGYAGLVTPARWAEMQASNFGDHGCLPEPTPEALAADLPRVLYEAQPREELGRALRRLVMAEYDLGRTTAEVEAVYAAAMAGN